MNIYLDIEGLASYLYEFKSLGKYRAQGNESHDYSMTMAVTLFFRQMLFLCRNREQVKAHSNYEVDVDFMDSDLGDVESEWHLLKNELSTLICKKYGENEQEVKNFIDDVFLKMPSRHRTFSKIGELNKQVKIDSIRDRYDYFNSLFLFEGTDIDLDRNIQRINQNYIEELGKIFLIDNEQINKSFYTRGLTNWTDIKQNIPYTNDIILVDPFLFSVEEPERFEQNVIGLLNTLICATAKDVKILIVICIKDIAGFLSFIRNVNDKEFKRITDSYQVTLAITYDKNLLHDRFIITYNRFIASGHSFAQYFGKDEYDQEIFKANGSVWLNMGSAASESNQEISKYALEYLNDNVFPKCQFIGSGKSDYFDIQIDSLLYDWSKFFSLSEKLYEALNEIKEKNPIPYQLLEKDDREHIHYKGIEFPKRIYGRENNYKVRITQVVLNSNRYSKYDLFAKYRLEKENRE